MAAAPDPLPREAYVPLVERALAEDLGRGDVTTDSTVVADQRAHGIFLVKSPCVLAGIDIACETFRFLDPDVRVTRHRPDGEICRPGEVVADVSGRAAALLSAERTALNLLQRLCGIATLTRRFVEAAGNRITVLDTRKTTPLLRRLEKYAVRAGGGQNHRLGLDAGVLIKDNHIRLAGGVEAAVRRVRDNPQATGLKIEVEAQSLDQVDEALEAGADIVMVDNMSVDDVREAVQRSRGRALVEISGNVTLTRMPLLAQTGADYVSVGALTHSAPAADISLEIEPLT